MTRANRHYYPGYVWHITHRCHKKEIKKNFFSSLPKIEKTGCDGYSNRKKRYGLKVLNYTVTSNHIHLIVFDKGKGEIAKSIQLVAGRVGQEYSRRKSRKGAFWEDRYHAVAVESGNHLIRCLTYIDLNMVRAGVVQHPSEWPWCGYNEIQNPPERYSLIDLKILMELCGFKDKKVFRKDYREWINEALKLDATVRESCWTESLAVGDKQFIDNVKSKLGVRAKGRNIIENEESCEIRELPPSYN